MQMPKILLSVIAVVLLTAGNANAALRMYGDVRPRHFNWAREAQANVPLPNARFTLQSGYEPMYDNESRKMWLPQPGRYGNTYTFEHVLFLHELGHVTDYAQLDRSERNEWRRIVNTTCAWWDYRCSFWRKGTSPDGATFIPQLIEGMAPGETFAEAYASCALNTPLSYYGDRGWPTYGWLPQIEQGTLCALVVRLASN